jgi:NADPH:quinone reductase-like Zn-dependent oxidoreductase
MLVRARIRRLRRIRRLSGRAPGEEAGQAVVRTGVGTFAVQIGKALGTEVTGVCSTRNVDLVRSLGADHVVDYTREDPTEGGRRYDLIIQLAGTRSPSDLRRALTKSGILLLSSGEPAGGLLGPLGRSIHAGALSPFVSQRLASFGMNPGREDLERLDELVEAGQVSPVMDRSYPLAEVPEAIRYVETGRARGKVVISTSS